MSWKLGLGDNEAHLEIQGEIDFDFFDGDNAKFEGPSDFVEELPHNGIGNVEGYAACSLGPQSCVDYGASDGVGIAEEDSQQFSQFSNKSSGKRVIQAIIPTLIASGEPEDQASCLLETSPDDGAACGFVRDSEEQSGSVSSSISVSDSEGVSSLSEDSLDGLSESESITDVTPLHSPYWCDSPQPRVLASKGGEKHPPIDDDAGAADLGPDDECHRSDSTKPKDRVRFASGDAAVPGQDADSLDLNLLVEAIKELEIQRKRKVVRERNCITPPPTRGRRNMSFSNDEVRRIDQENQRLLKRILAQQNGPRSKMAAPTLVPARVSSQAINRQRQQRRIEIENLALLKRIENVKPSRELCRPYSKQQCSCSPSTKPSSRSASASHTSSRPAYRRLSATCSSQSSSNSSGINSQHSSSDDAVFPICSRSRIKSAKSSLPQ